MHPNQIKIESRFWQATFPFRGVATGDKLKSETHTFENDNLWYDPTDQIDRKKITVYIELNNPEKYYIDLTFLAGEKQ